MVVVVVFVKCSLRFAQHATTIDFPEGLSREFSRIQRESLKVSMARESWQH
jgi:hypothetical protein